MIVLAEEIMSHGSGPERIRTHTLKNNLLFFLTSSVSGFQHNTESLKTVYQYLAVVLITVASYHPWDTNKMQNGHNRQDTKMAADTRTCNGVSQNTHDSHRTYRPLVQSKFSGRFTSLAPEIFKN
jgi:hypothetical protein